jgi:4-hydroxyacetophenone monooxygenase
VAAEFEEDRCLWTVRARTPSGDEKTLTANAVISAVGQLNRPRYPAIQGRDDFRGPSFHSACWGHGIDLRGKRVAVIGTGASAFQFVPEIAGTVESLVVFQRTPPWLGPTPNYHDLVAESSSRSARRATSSPASANCSPAATGLPTAAPTRTTSTTG